VGIESLGSFKDTPDEIMDEINEISTPSWPVLKICLEL